MKDKNKIYPYDKQINFFRLIDEAMAENIDEIENELLEANIDIREVQNSLLNFIKDQNSELLIERGKLFRKLYEEEKLKPTVGDVPPDIAFAFRKNDNENSTDNISDDDLQKLTTLKKASKKLSGKSDEQGNKNS